MMRELIINIICKEIIVVYLFYELELTDIFAVGTDLLIKID